MDEIRILHDDADFFVIDKPAGLATQGGVGIKNCVESLLEKRLGQKIFLVHRLDKDTSGVLLIGKNSKAAGEFSHILKSPHTQKTYSACCFGIPTASQGLWQQPIRGQNAKTEFFLKNHCTLSGSEKEFSLSNLRFLLHTGRTHQIRIHCAINGFPIIGDDKYGDYKSNKAFAREFSVKKLQLICESLSLRRNNQEFFFKSQFFHGKIPHLIG